MEKENDTLTLKLIVLLLSLLNGGWMIFDGLHVIRKGKYFGPDEPGSWAKLVRDVGVDPFKIGPLFILLGVLWICASTGFLLGLSGAWAVLLAVAFCTLWYIKVGTVLSALTIILLLY